MVIARATSAWRRSLGLSRSLHLFRPGVAALYAVTVIVGLGAAVLHAHEAGTTAVVASFSHDDTYSIDLTTDAGALLTRLELARKQPRSAPASGAELQRGLDALCDEVPRHIAITFDDQPVSPRATCVIDTAGSSAAESLNALGVTVFLRGAMPRGARTFRWRYDLTFASYALSVRAVQAEVSKGLWLEGGEESPTLAVVRLPPPASRWQMARTNFTFGFARILPGGIEQILFVLGIFLLNRRVAPTLWQIGLFGAGHAIALALARWDLMAFPPSALQPLIALSIVYVAAENSPRPEDAPVATGAGPRRWIAARRRALRDRAGAGAAGVACAEWSRCAERSASRPGW